MTPWIMLAPVLLALCTGSYISYVCKDRPWFIPAFLCLQIVTGTLWCLSARWCDARTLFSFGLAWDVVAILAFNVLPLVACGVRLSPTAWCGLGLVVAGALLVKVSA